MTFRRLATFSTAFSGLALISHAAHAQTEPTAANPVFTPVRQAASQITPPIHPEPKARFRRELISALPVSLESGVAPASVAVKTNPLPGMISPPPGADTVISGPHQTYARVTTNFVLNSAQPVAVPFVATGAVGNFVMKDQAAPANTVSKAPAVESEDDKANRELLAKLEADLDQTSQRLDRAKGQLTDGQKALNQFAGELQQAMLEAGPDARGLNPFVRVAQRYMGTPYVWGGVSARGFDCSGFIIRVMQDLGYRSLPHSAAEQFRYGQPVAQELLKPGDLVFFANTYKPGISHVGIYLGRRRFIHAANSHVGTIVSSLDQPKWQEKYAGGRRLVPLRA
jgi:cell wall-associated NlpC family hydrolase